MSRENAIGQDLNQAHVTEDKLGLKWRWADKDECMECMNLMASGSLFK